jgi:hypothetical protein
MNQVLEEIGTTLDAAHLRWSRRLLRHRGAVLKARRTRSVRFEERLQQRWREPLDLYELALYLTQNLGAGFSNVFGSFANKAKFRALVRLHGNTALIAGEVLQLLMGGFASGAHARWRSLHETSIIAAFLTHANEDTAVRFIAHSAVKSFEDAEKYQEHCTKLGETPFSSEEFAVLRHRRDKAVERYGSPFLGSYGWAYEELLRQNPGRKGRINFSDIEAATSLSFWNPFYRMASHAVHPTAQTISFNIGSCLSVEESILAGPSNYGLAGPGYHSLISTNLVNKALVSYGHDLVRDPEEDTELATRIKAHEPVFKSMVELTVLEDVADRAGEAFIRVQREIEAEDAQAHRANPTPH